MTFRMILSLSCALLAGCGGSDPAAPAAPAAPGTTPGTTTASTATGTGGKGGLDIGTNDAAGGALFFNDHPAPGEATVSGLVAVIQGGTQGAPSPADTVVTLNGVTLVRTAPGSLLFAVDPAGQQPTLGADGFLHIAASSTLLGVTRQLNLFCPAAFPVTLTPAAGSSLPLGSSVKLAWASGALPVQGRLIQGLAEPSVALWGFNAPNQMISLGTVPEPLLETATGATVPVSATTIAGGYMVELRYPGVYFIDGQTGGACARSRRFTYAK